VYHCQPGSKLSLQLTTKQAFFLKRQQFFKKRRWSLTPILAFFRFEKDLNGYKEIPTKQRLGTLPDSSFCPGGVFAQISLKVGACYCETLTLNEL
jgi:hypothetical protein